MKLALLTVGKPKAGYIAQGLEDYSRRLKGHGGCELLFVRPERAAKGAGGRRVMAAEGKRLLARLDEKDMVWALDRKGGAWNSEQWARELDAARRLAPRRLTLIIGGPWGLDQAVLQRAQRLVSLGPPTLPHELAALVAWEQLYRAHSILAGSPYHRA